MTKNERMGLFILKNEIKRCKFHVQRVIEYTNVTSQLQHVEDRNIALMSQESQLDCHLTETNDAFDQLEMVIDSEWERNKKKIEVDLSLTKKKKTAKI
jgi:hypothetical protein